MENESRFEKAYKLNVNDKAEKKDNLTYLSWAWAWAEFKKIYPEATYEIKKFNDRPYLYDENTGYMVFTEVTADNQTHEMWLPVMNYNNKTMLNHEYTYKAWEWKNGQKVQVEKTVEAATMFDINKSIMRCLTKNLAMFGLGLYIYAGEDLPESDALDETNKEPKPKANLDMKTGEIDPKPWEKWNEQRDSCPECQKPLKERNSAKGPFLGCSGYPKCRYTKNIQEEITVIQREEAPLPEDEIEQLPF